MKTFKYIIGEPGVGKSSVMKALMNNFFSPVRLILTEPVKHTAFSFFLDSSAIEIVLGSYDREFGGTDTLSYTCVDQVKQLLMFTNCQNIYGEGDRIANRPFFDWCKANLDFKLIVIQGSAELVKARRLQRGSQQNETWLRGRKSKVENLAAEYNAWILDGNKTPEQLSADILADKYDGKVQGKGQESLF